MIYVIIARIEFFKILLYTDLSSPQRKLSVPYRETLGLGRYTDTTVATYADDTAVLASHADPASA